MSLSPCWYWIPIAAQPKSCAIRTAASYILRPSRTWPSVSSVASSRPSANFIPREVSQA